jgi:hypothetical protein
MAAFDPSKPNIARIYDALRDGKDNFGLDRDAAEAIREIAADGQKAAHAYEVTRAVMRETAAGSLLVISHASADQATPDEIKTITEIYDKARTPIHLRARDEITAFFDGLEITGPGVVDINAWKNPAHKQTRTIGYGGAAVKH